MPENKGHIEESIRKAFESFEIPMNGEDWNIIEENISINEDANDETAQNLRAALKNHTEDPLERDWLAIAAALDTDIPMGGMVSDETAPDPMESSIRNVFADYTLPVTGRDWRIIATKLNLDGSFSFLNWRIMLPLLLLFSVLGIGSYALWNESNNPRKAIAEISHQSNLKKQDAADFKKSNDKSANFGAESNKNSISNPGKLNGLPPNGVSSSGSSQGNSGNGNVSGNADIKTNTQTPIPKDPIRENPVTEGPQAKDPGVKTPEPTQPELEEVLIKDFSDLKSTGLRMQIPGMKAEMAEVMALSAQTLPMKPLAKASLPSTKPTNGLEVYTSLQGNMDPGKIKGTLKPVQSNPGIVSGNAPMYNLRLEAGLGIRTGSVRFTAGLAGETTVASEGTYKIKIPMHFLAYLDVNGDTLFLFPRAWRDSTIHVSNGPKMSWMEIPLGIEKSFLLTNKLKLTLGATLNAGMLLQSSGKMANPWISEDSTKWQFVEGETHSNSLTIDVKDNINKLRIGSGLQLGVSKQMKNMEWGIQVQTRYYFNDLYKSKVPAVQRNMNYGVQVKIAYKI